MFLLKKYRFSLISDYGQLEWRFNGELVYHNNADNRRTVKNRLKFSIVDVAVHPQIPINSRIIKIAIYFLFSQLVNVTL